jgi:KAP family P-loop domain
VDTDFINKNISIASATALFKTFLIGILVSETFFFSQEVSQGLVPFVTHGNHEYQAIVLGGVGLLLLFAYLIIRGCFSVGLKILRSERIDILALFLSGFLISFKFGGLGSELYEKTIQKIDPYFLLFAIGIPLLMAIGLVVRALQIKFTNRETEPFFVTDIEGKRKADDLLNYADSATRFAERVFNGGSPDSLVFGIDAPWGIGKSTFLNYCIESWNEKKYKNKIIVYKFNPLRYEDRTNLLDKFIDGLVATLQKSTFAPEIRPLISKYSRLIKSKSTFSFLGFEVELLSGTYTVDDAFDDLEVALEGLDKKVIVVVDDLDRLSFSAIKDVLFTIKKSFTLPNISYVLCYDTENIVAFEKDGDVEKVREFLEKFVNVKTSLFLDSDVLSRYVSENFEIALQNNLQLDPYTRDNLKVAMSALIDIYKSPDFHHYQAFLGDVRKLKRLINTMMLFEIEKTDFENSDFDKLDLVHLILIYINYPNLFRKIYNTETGGKRGFFSALIPYDDGYPVQDRNARDRDGSRFENSTYFTDYVTNTLKEENQRFLVNKVFNVSTRLPEDRRIDSVPEVMKKTLACFNGDGAWTGGRNLQEYLHLIVKLSKPQKRGQYKFYLNMRDKIRNGTSIEEIFEKEEDFQFSKSESSHEQFWRIVVNTARELEPNIGTNLIAYLLNNMQNYSFFTNKEIGVGLRDDIDYFLVKLLDEVGWSDPSGGHTENTEENIVEIAEWVFGEGRHVDNGVLDTLSNEDRGIIGLYDLLAFRLFCSADRGGDIFNLSRAIAKHGDPNAPTQGSTRDIAIVEMREMSQRVFSIFKERYITPGVNIFSLIESLTLADFAGKYLGFIEEQIKLGKITKEEQDTYIASLKSRMKSFITYQLGNTEVSHGVGCGFYDETGTSDEKGIATLINNYLFDKCFNPEIDANNYEHFLDYLLINFASVFASRRGRDYIPHINEFTKVLDRTRLASYWRTYGDAMKVLNFTTKEKTIYAGNYTATYEQDLEDVFKVLDTLVVETAPRATAEILELPAATE